PSFAIAETLGAMLTRLGQDSLEGRVGFRRSRTQQAQRTPLSALRPAGLMDECPMKSCVVRPMLRVMSFEQTMEGFGIVINSRKLRPVLASLLGAFASFAVFAPAAQAGPLVASAPD